MAIAIHTQLYLDIDTTMSIYNSNSVFHQLDLDLLKHFFAIASFGGFSKASRAIGVSQPALSLGLQRLEKSLDVTLIRRDSRQFELTKSGLALLNFCQRLEGHLETVVDALGTKTVSVRRRLRIGTALSIGFGPLAELCVNASRSAETDGPVELELKAENSYQLLAEVNAGTLDAALVLDDVYDSTLSLSKLSTDHLIFVTGKFHDKVLAGREWRNAMNEVPLITYPRETPMRTLVDKLRMKERLAFRTVHSVNSLDALKMLLLRDVGGAFVLRSLVAGELKTNHLIEQRLDISLPKCQFLLATRPGEQGNVVAKLITELLG